MSTEEKNIPVAEGDGGAVRTVNADGPRDDAAVMEEHRAALRRMRAAMAVDMLLEASGARDTEVVRRLLDTSPDDIACGADGVPDVRAVREKLSGLKRDCGYLFRDGMIQGNGMHASAPDESGRGRAAGISVQPAAEEDDDRLTDAEFYRRKRMKRP
ncbi:MAG: hypothetical protein ACI3XM_10590 [Eubacteriales bacterium]